MEEGIKVLFLHRKGTVDAVGMRMKILHAQDRVPTTPTKLCQESMVKPVQTLHATDVIFTDTIAQHACALPKLE